MHAEFYVIQFGILPHRPATRVTPYHNLDNALNSFRYLGLGRGTMLMRRSDCVIIASKGDVSDTYPMSDVLTYEEKQIEKAMSKSSSQEKASDFDPPVRVGGCDAKCKPRGDIAFFKDGQCMNAHAWVARTGALKLNGWKLNSHGSCCNLVCAHCGCDQLVDLFYIKGELWRGHDEQSFMHCLTCGYTVEQIAVYESEVLHV